MARKVAEQLIDTLVQSGVERIYAVTGDSLNEVNEAVRKNDKIKWIHVRHEETGAYAAAAEAQLTGRPGCCAGSSGPGHVHLINGLYDAHRSGAPVITIASTIPTGEFGTEYFQETNTIKLFNDCSYYNEVATTPTQFPRMLQSAIQTAITRKGVSVIGLPGDLAKASAVSVDSSVRNYPVVPEVCPAEEDLAQLADLLNKYKRITLFCGIGCRGAHEEVIALSEKLNAPVVYTFKGKMEVQYENPYEVGMTGLLGMPSGYYSMHEAEVLLMLGTDFPYSAFLPDDITARTLLKHSASDAITSRFPDINRITYPFTGLHSFKIRNPILCLLLHSAFRRILMIPIMFTARIIVLCLNHHRRRHLYFHGLSTAGNSPIPYHFQLIILVIFNRVYTDRT